MHDALHDACIYEPSPALLPWQPNHVLATLRVAVPMAVEDAIHPLAIHPLASMVPPCGTHYCPTAPRTQHLEQLIAETNEEQR